MTTLNASTPSLTTNSPNVYPRSAEASGAENPSEKPLSPEVQQGLKRFTYKESPYNFFNSKKNEHKLSDFLLDPVKNLNTFLTLVGTSVFGLLGTSTLQSSSKIKNLTVEQLQELRGTGYIWIIGAILTAGTGLWEAFQIKNRNKDTLQGIQTLGDNATRQEWIDYKKTHPEISKGS